MDLFEYQSRETAKSASPLADRMRPRRLDEFIGHHDVVGSGSLLRQAITDDQLFSMILWGPPGCGKTTLARIIAAETRCHFVQFSAVLSGVKDIRLVIEEAQEKLRLHRKRTILFVDEIHRFNKAQQDAFLHHVESGLITLIGATTENPSFEVIAPLLSRCRVIPLQMHTEEDLGAILDRALLDSERGLGKHPLALAKDARTHLIRNSEGDARMALNSLEIAARLVLSTRKAPAEGGRLEITLADIETAIQRKALLYDKTGEEHYNLISALHKSLRGSDPDAALYWLGRMLMAGEDPFYIARRMVRFASEDVGNADPQALTVAMNAVETFKFLGHPEGELALAQAAVYLATAPKSNRVYSAWGGIREVIKKTGVLPVPLHIRNAPTQLMKTLGYGKGYQYAHDSSEGYIPQEYLPEKLRGKRFYFPTDRGFEKTIQERLRLWQGLKNRKGSPK